MNYHNAKIAVGMVMMDNDGYDAMQVFHGIIKQDEGGPFLHCPGETPMEMSPKWLERLKPVETDMGERFQGADYCLIIGSIPGNQ